MANRPSLGPGGEHRAAEGGTGRAESRFTKYPESGEDWNSSMA